MVPETSVSSCNQLTRLCARKDFIEFRRREKLQIIFYEYGSKFDARLPMCTKTEHLFDEEDFGPWK
jgi:hypothetical protein